MAVQTHTHLPLHHLDVDTYNRIVASGALDGRRIELLDGLVVEMSPQSASHATVLRRLAWHFASVKAQVQTPIEIRPACEPEPDLAVLEAEPAPSEHPRTALFVIEVAVSSHMIDRDVKTRMYAQAGIPTYWLIDVPARAIEVRTQPGPDGYARCDTYREGETVPCPLDGVEDLHLAALLAGVGVEA